MRKLLSIILTLCLAFTTIGSLSVVNAQDVTITETYNVTQGAECILPDGTVVDTTYPGYQIISGTDGNTYRVNVGTYGIIMYDDMQGHSTTMSTTTPGTGTTTKSGVIGGTLLIDNYNITNSSTADTSQRVVTEGTNKVIAIGTESSSWNFDYTPTNLLTAPFRLSMDVKIVDFKPKEATVSNNVAWEMRMAPNSKTMMQLRVYANIETHKYSGITLRYYDYENGTTDKGKQTDYLNITDIDPAEDTVTTDWFNIEFVIDPTSDKLVYDLYVDKVLIAKGLRLPSNFSGGIQSFEIAKRSANTLTNDKVDDAVSDAMTYFDNVKITDNVIVYPSKINGEGLTDSVYSGVKSGTVSVPVIMSDDKTQNFTATYTLTDAQTVAAGTYNVEAIIPGFSEKVTVAVTVKDSKALNKTINSYTGATVNFPTELDGMSVAWKNYSGNAVTTADTTVMGRKLYTGTIADGRTVTYTVNVGEYNKKLEDKMSDHDDNYEDGLKTISPGTGDGFTLEMKNEADKEAAKHSSTVESDSTGNKYLQVTAMTPSDNAKWLVKDSFNGDYKVSYDIKIENAATAESYYPYRFMVLDTQGDMIASAALYVNKDLKLYMRGNKYGGSLDSKDVTSLAGWSVTNSVGSTDGWCNVEIFIHTEEQTFDIIFEGMPVHTGLPFLANEEYGAGRTDGALGAVSFDRRQEATTATAMIDNVEIHTYNCFTDELDDAIDVVTAVGKSTADVPLVLSNGGIRNFTIKLPCDVSSIAHYSNVEAEISGFDGTVTANVKVCNYDVTGVNLKNGSEFVTAPVAGGEVESIVMKKLTDTNAQTAIVALYGADDNIKAIKTADLSGITFETDNEGKSKETVVSVEMTLPENTTSGDYIRVYVWDSKAKLQPLDMVTDLTFDYNASPDIYIAAASTYETYSRTANPSQWPKTGVGQALTGFVSKNVSIINIAKSGSATHTFINDGLWDRILNNIKTGDYVIVSFGHNDQVKCTPETHPDGCVYGTNFQYFIESARERGANPIVCSPIVRRLEGIDGNPKFNTTAHEHITKLEQVCADFQVPYIDMTTLTMNYLQGLDNKETKDVNEAIEKSKELYMIDIVANMSEYKDNPLWVASRYNPDGEMKDTNYSTDNTHTNIYGAKIYAKILAEEIAKLDNNLSNFVVNTDTTITYPALD